MAVICSHSLIYSFIVAATSTLRTQGEKFQGTHHQTWAAKLGKMTPQEYNHYYDDTDTRKQRRRDAEAISTLTMNMETQSETKYVTSDTFTRVKTKAPYKVGGVQSTQQRRIKR